MKHLALFFLALSLLTSSLVATPVETFCAQFAAGAEVRVYRGFPERGYDKNLYDAAQEAGCISLLGQVFYPELKTLDSKDAAAWLARATSADSYYPATKTDEKFHADIGFWCVTPDHKNEAYCLVSFAASQAHFWIAGKELTVAITIDFEDLCRGVLAHAFEAESNPEKSGPEKGRKP